MASSVGEQNETGCDVLHTRPQKFHGIGEESMGCYQGFVPEIQWGKITSAFFELISGRASAVRYTDRIDTYTGVGEYDFLVIVNLDMKRDA